MALTPPVLPQESKPPKLPFVRGSTVSLALAVLYFGTVLGLAFMDKDDLAAQLLGAIPYTGSVQ